MLRNYLDALSDIRELGSHGGTVEMFDLLSQRINEASGRWESARLNDHERIQLGAARERSLAYITQQRDRAEQRSKSE